MNTALFTLKNLDVKIGNKKILSIPELAINSHKITAIIGPNGAGKSHGFPFSITVYFTDILHFFKIN